MINYNLTNEDNENFVFGVKDGVRGFYTNPSRADDSFIPFSSNFSELVLSDLIWSDSNGTCSKTSTYTATKKCRLCAILSYTQAGSANSGYSYYAKINDIKQEITFVKGNNVLGTAIFILDLEKDDIVTLHVQVTSPETQRVMIFGFI